MQWVEANPYRVNDRDDIGWTPLYNAVRSKMSLPLVLWLVDVKGADVNGKTSDGQTPLYCTQSLGLFSALLDRGADLTVMEEDAFTPLMWHVYFPSYADKLAFLQGLLQDPRVQSNVNMQNRLGNTALHFATEFFQRSIAKKMVKWLLLAGANASLINRNGDTPLAWLRRTQFRNKGAILLLEHALDGEKALLLVKTRLVITANSNATAPSCLRDRVARGQPLSRRTLVRVTLPHKGTGGRYELSRLIVFLLGMGGGSRGEGMPRDVFLVLVDLVAPSWDPLRKRGGAGPPLQA